jgi:hypothetical protein
LQTHREFLIVLTMLRGSSSSDSESDCEVMPLSKMVRQLSAEWKQLGEQHEAGLSPPTTPLDPAFYREAESDTER